MTALEHCFFCRLRTGAKISVFISSISAIGFMSLCFTRYLQLKTYDTLPTAFLSFFTGVVVCYFITLITAIVLFYGIVKRIPNLFMPWIMCSTLSCLAVTTLIVYVVVSYRREEREFSKLDSMGFIYHIVHLIITMLATIGVWSYKRYLQKRIVYEYDYQREPRIPYNFMFHPPPYEGSPPSYVSNSDLIIEGQERNFDPRPYPENNQHPRATAFPSENTLSIPIVETPGSTPSLPPRRNRKPEAHVYGNLPQRREPPTIKIEEIENEQNEEVFQISSTIAETPTGGPSFSAEPEGGTTTSPKSSSSTTTATETPENETVITRPLQTGGSTYVYVASQGPKVHRKSHQKRKSSHHQSGNSSHQADRRSRNQRHSQSISPTYVSGSAESSGRNYRDAY